MRCVDGGSQGTAEPRVLDCAGNLKWSVKDNRPYPRQACLRLAGRRSAHPGDSDEVGDAAVHAVIPAAEDEAGIGVAVGVFDFVVAGVQLHEHGFAELVGAVVL